MSKVLAELQKEQEKFNNKQGKFKDISYIKYDELQNLEAPIINRYKRHIQDKLIPIIELFEYFCSVVRNNADNMTKFVSQLTVEDFSKIISGGDENE